MVERTRGAKDIASPAKRDDRHWRGERGMDRGLVEYVQSEQRTFDEEPFNLLDGLTFATLSYLKFEWHEDLRVMSTDRVALREVITGTDRETLLRMGWLRESPRTDEFLQAVASSRRFRDTSVCLYAEERVDTVEKQFSAVTFLPGDGRAYVTFRGTDGSMVGWKENFNIVFREFTPSQMASVAYTTGVASAFSGSLVLLGHSKGGSHAHYAALCVPEEVFQRIDTVVNFDGPSFLSDPSPRVNDPRFQKVFHKIVPEASLFGLLLEQGDRYRVVASSGSLKRQHEPYSWMVQGNDFRYVNSLNDSARWADGGLSAWLKTRTVEERHVFVDALYEVLRAADAQTIFDLRDRFGSTVHAAAGALTKLDPETRRLFFDMLKTLGGSLRRQAHAIRMEKQEARLEAHREAREKLQRERQGERYVLVECVPRQPEEDRGFSI